MIGLNEDMFRLQAETQMAAYYGDVAEKPKSEKNTPFHQFLQQRFQELQKPMLDLKEHPMVECIKTAEEAGMQTDVGSRETYRLKDGTDLMIIDENQDYITGEKSKSISYHVTNAGHNTDIWYRFDLDGDGLYRSGSRQLETYRDKAKTSLEKVDLELDKGNGNEVYFRTEYDLKGTPREDRMWSKYFYENRASDKPLIDSYHSVDSYDAGGNKFFAQKDFRSDRYGLNVRTMQDSGKEYYTLRENRGEDGRSPRTLEVVELTPASGTFVPGQSQAQDVLARVFQNGKVSQEVVKHYDDRMGIREVMKEMDAIQAQRTQKRREAVAMQVHSGHFGVSEEERPRMTRQVLPIAIPDDSVPTPPSRADASVKDSRIRLNRGVASLESSNRRLVPVIDVEEGKDVSFHPDAYD